MKFLPIILFICFAETLHAQSTLTGANFNPQPGDVFVSYYQNGAYPSPGGPGANITWDFHSLLPENADTTTYVVCSSTPACNHFPGSNIADIEDGSYDYMTATSNYLLDNGFLIPGSEGDTSIAGGDTTIKYPFTYGSSFTNMFTNQNYGLQNGETDVYKQTIVCDGYGTLILPNGTFQNVLRLRNVEYEVSIFNGGTFHYTDTIYSWVMPGFHAPLLTIGYSLEQETGDADTTVSYSIAFAGSTAVNNVDGTTAFELYPNPAKEVINIKFTLPQSQVVSITILDILGKQIASVGNDVYNMGMHQLTYNTANLPKGLYLVHLQSSIGSVTRKIEVM